MVKYEIRDGVTIPDYAKLRFIKEINIRDNNGKPFDPGILDLLEMDSFSMLENESLRNDLKLLVEFRERKRLLSRDINGPVIVTSDEYNWYEGIRKNYEMLRKLINHEALALKEYSLDDSENPIHGKIEIR